MNFEIWTILCMCLLLYHSNSHTNHIYNILVPYTSTFSLSPAFSHNKQTFSCLIMPTHTHPLSLSLFSNIPYTLLLNLNLKYPTHHLTHLNLSAHFVSYNHNIHIWNIIFKCMFIPYYTTCYSLGFSDTLPSHILLTFKFKFELPTHIVNPQDSQTHFQLTHSHNHIWIWNSTCAMFPPTRKPLTHLASYTLCPLKNTRLLNLKFKYHFVSTFMHCLSYPQPSHDIQFL